MQTKILKNHYPKAASQPAEKQTENALQENTKIVRRHVIQVKIFYDHYVVIKYAAQLEFESLVYFKRG